MAAKYIVIFVSADSEKEANKIINTLLKTKLVACGNMITGVTSRFWWKGRIDQASEVLITLKAQAKDFKRIEQAIKKMHTYDIPEIVALPILAGSKAYLGWIDESVK